MHGNKETQKWLMREKQTQKSEGTINERKN